MESRRKVKKSFSISVESEALIRRTREERGASSESEALDALLSEVMEMREQSAIDSAYQSYYDSLTDEESAEERAWASFAESQLIEGAR
jgi:hypothetical protein